MIVLVKLVGVEKSDVASCVSDAIEKFESSLLALMGVAHLEGLAASDPERLKCLVGSETLKVKSGYSLTFAAKP